MTLQKRFIPFLLILILFVSSLAAACNALDAEATDDFSYREDDLGVEEETVSSTPPINNYQAPIPNSPWQTRGMGGGGGLNYVSISPHNGQEMYVATDMSAVFHTTDFGADWQTVPFTQLTGQADANVRFTNNPDVLYAIHWYDPWWTAQRAVRSDDGGQTFHPLPSEPPVPDEDHATRLFADPDHTERIVVGYESGIYFSSDGGTSYQLVAEYDGSSLYAIRLAGVDWNSSTITVATNQGLYRSTNGGSSFASFGLAGLPAGNGMVNFTAAQSGAETVFLAITMPQDEIEPVLETAVSPTRLWRSVNGNSWQELSLPSAIPFYIESFAGNLDTFYLAGSIFRDEAHVPAVWRTDDGGDSWQQLFESLDNQNIATGWVGDESAYSFWWDGLAWGFDVDPNNPDRLVVSSNLIYTSEDGGQSWQAAFVQPEDRNVAGTAVSPAHFYQTTGIDPTASYSIHWADEQTLITAYTDISSQRSIDGGLHWQNGGDIGLYFNSVYQVIQGANGRLYAAVSEQHDIYMEPQDIPIANDTQAGGIYYSDDKGASWAQLHDFGAAVVWMAIDPNDDNTLYASVVNNDVGGIHVTHNLDAGTDADFTLLPAPERTRKRPFNIRILNDGTLVTSWSHRTEDDNETFTESSGIFISTDGGQTWQDRSDPSMTIWTMDVVVDPHDPTQSTWYTAVHGHSDFNLPFNVSENGGLYRTTDRGQSWIKILAASQPPRTQSITIHPSDPNIAYVTTEGDGLLITNNLTDSTPSFQQDPTYPFRAPTRVFFNPYNENELWTTTYGNGMLMRSLEESQTFLPTIIATN